MTNDDIPPRVRLRFSTRNTPLGGRDHERTQIVPTTPGHSGALDFIRLSQMGLPVGTKLTLEMPGDYVRTWEILPTTPEGDDHDN